MNRLDLTTLYGQKVYATQEGKRMGIVNRIAIDSDEGKVIGLLIQEDDSEYLVPIKVVVTFGEDAVMIGSEDQLQPPEQIQEISENPKTGRAIIGLKILTEAGKTVGEVAAIHFDAETSKITHYKVSGGAFKDLVEGAGLLSQDGVVSIGQDAIVATEAAIQLAVTMKAQPGVKHEVQQIQAATKKVMHTLKQKVDNFRPGTKRGNDS